MKIHSASDLKSLEEEGRSTLYPQRIKISVGMSTCGLAAGAADIYECFRQEAQRHNVDIELAATGCLGFCQQEPLVDIRMPEAGRVLYARLSPDDTVGMVETLATGMLPHENALAVIADGTPNKEGSPSRLPDIPLLHELPFYARQQKIVLNNCGRIDPLRVEEYIARGGYIALAQVLSDADPLRVVEQIVQSGLRGRGGGGFPTGKKWQICSRNTEMPKYIICNADEGDPGAYMDRTVLEGDPFSVIEGLTIGAYAIGASEGYIYIRDEYPLAIERLRNSLARAYELGLLGDNIFDSGFDFHIEMVRGAGAFVCGEETALIASIEGGEAEPRPKPPFPAQSGLWKQPTVINNVKTLAAVPVIIRNGADWYASMGSNGNAGTVVFSLVGQAAQTGLVEVPLGLTLHELVEEIGGGSINPDKAIKAVQTGGPSGGCLPVNLFHLPIDYETLTQYGSIMGSGGMVVMDQDTCMVDVARYFLAFTRAESCGKCTPCREGTRVMHDILTRITNGKGNPEDLDLLQEVAQWVKSASLCGLGQTAPNPVLSTLRYFKDEYEAHVLDKFCPAGVCRDLICLTIRPDLCDGCGLCRRECPSGAISGQKKQPHFIDGEKCIRCKICVDVCPQEAVEIGRMV
jgi:NADH:ubiquinone oxidoreductase subunit F (NADH-binding)/(2Fe-2S) ferredoxin